MCIRDRVLGFGPETGGREAHDLGAVHPLHVEGELLGVESGQIEQVLQEAPEAPCFGPDHGGGGGGVLGRPVGDGVGVADAVSYTHLDVYKRQLLDGQGDPALAPEGRVQAEKVCARLAHERIDAIYVTTLRRTAQTAERLALSLIHI